MCNQGLHRNRTLWGELESSTRAQGKAVLNTIMNFSGYTRPGNMSISSELVKFSREISCFWVGTPRKTLHGVIAQKNIIPNYILLIMAKYDQYCHVVCVTIDSVNGFIDHLYTAPPLISTIHKSPQHPSTCCVFTSRSQVTVSNSGNSSASRAQVLSSQTPVQNWTTL
jgi:hypothetical protein